MGELGEGKVASVPVRGSTVKPGLLSPVTTVFVVCCGPAQAGCSGLPSCAMTRTSTLKVKDKYKTARIVAGDKVRARRSRRPRKVCGT